MCDLILSINWSDTAIISGIIGVIGTLLGTLIGFLLNYFVNKGKFKIYLRFRDFKFLQDENDTILKNIVSEFLFYNTTNEIKSIINPHFVLKIDGKEYKFDCFVKNENTNFQINKCNNPITQYDILPKSSLWVTFTVNENTSFELVPNSKMQFYFCFINSKNLEENIDLNFNSHEYFNIFNVLIKK